MTEISISEFLRREVFPRLDAVEAQLLTSYNPKQKASSGSYPLSCPACKAKEAFYYPFSGFINCARKNECGRSTSIWDAMLGGGYQHSEVFTVLCEAARVEPPKNGRYTETTNEKAQPRLGKAVWLITQSMAKENPDAFSAFQRERGYTDAQMAAMGLGFYTSPADLIKQLANYGYTQADAVAHGYVEADTFGKIINGLAGRIVGYWSNLDGDDRLWGRIPTGSGDKLNPKYKFAARLKKDIPYLFANRKRSVLVCVEGTMDAWALQLSEIWGCAVGGASINSSQAMFLHNRGITEVAHMVDGDNAGWNGAVASIRNCESLGITTSIIPLGEGMDDADALLRAGKSDVLMNLVDNRLNGGHYLALMLRGLYAASSLDLQAINRIHTAATSLTPASRTVFERYTALFGVRADLRLEAGRIFGELVHAGLTVDEAIASVQRRTGHTISITKDSEHE